MMRRLCRVAGSAAIFLPLPVLADDSTARPWQMMMSGAASPVREQILEFHNGILIWVISAITLFVLGLLVTIVIRFRASANPKPSRTTHHTGLEIAWTVLPVTILALVAIPSFRLLYYMDRTPDAEMTIKVIGHQWYWSYEYPDHGGFSFDSYMLADNELKPGQQRLLEVDNRLVLPVDTNIRILVVSADVMHSWLVPQLGVQIYATPGRTNETWVRVTRDGAFFGQCNQICGVNHGFMPVAVEALPKDQFQHWVEQAKTRFAAKDAPRPALAAALP